MAHGISLTDSFIANGRANGQAGDRAWHGLGICCTGIKTADELLRISGLDWQTHQLPLYGSHGESEDMIYVDSHRLNIRSDNQQILGVVGKGYRPFHNSQMIELIEAIDDGGQAEVETLGSIHGGKRVWALIRGETFSVNQNDETATYLACTNSHDGSLAINLFWTSVRIVCANTFRAALGGMKNGISIRHEGSIMTKAESAKIALGLMKETTAREAETAKALDGYQMTREALQRFYIDVYSQLEGAIPSDPKTDSEMKQYQKAAETISHWGLLFDQDRKRTLGNASLWTAFISVTEWYDHHRRPQIKDAQAREDARIASALFGENANRKQKAREIALAAI